MAELGGSYEVGPTGEEGDAVIEALIESLVDPLLPLSVSSVLPKEDDQISVAKQMHAVALLYNYYYRRQNPDLKFLDPVSFSKLAVVLKPTLAPYMKLATGSQLTKSDISNEIFTITERAIKDACDAALSLNFSEDFPTLEGWQVTKVAVLLIDPKKENCMLRYGDVTKGVWSLIEKELSTESVKTNPTKEISKDKIGDKRKRNSLSAYDNELLQLGYDAVKDITGIGSSDLKLLEAHVTYSLTKEKSAVQFYMMQCSQPFSKKEEASLKFLVESLQGPLVEKLDCGMWETTTVVEFFHMLPYVQFISCWLLGKDVRLQTLESHISQNTSDIREKEVDQSVNSNLQVPKHNSNNNDSGNNNSGMKVNMHGKMDTWSSKKAKSLNILEDEKIKVNSKISFSEKEVTQTIKLDLPVPKHNVNNNNAGNKSSGKRVLSPEKMPTENHKKVTSLEKKKIKVDSKISDTGTEKMLIGTDSLTGKFDKKGDIANLGNTMPEESGNCCPVILENKKIKANSKSSDTEKEGTQTVKLDLPVPKHNVKYNNSGNKSSGTRVHLPEKMPTENHKKVTSPDILEKRKMKVGSKISDTDIEKMSIGIDSGNCCSVILENKKIKANSKSSDTEKEGTQTVKLDLPVPKHNVNNNYSGNKNSGTKVNSPEKIPTENRKKATCPVLLENKKIKVDSKISDTDTEKMVIGTFDKKDDIANLGKMKEESGNCCPVILENKKIKANSKISDAEKEGTQAAKLDLPVLNHKVNSNYSGHKNSGTKVTSHEKIPSENQKKATSPVILENKKIKVESIIPDTDTKKMLICIDTPAGTFDKKGDIANLGKMKEENGKCCEILDKASDECGEKLLLLSGPSNELTNETESENTSMKVGSKIRVYHHRRKNHSAPRVVENDDNSKAIMVDSSKSNDTECRDGMALSEVKREISVAAKGNQLVQFEDKSKHKLELQNLSASEDSQNALALLFGKRQELYSQMCNIEDSLASCESYISRIRDGGEFGLARNCINSILSGNHHSMLEHGNPQCGLKETNLSGFYLPEKSSFEDLEYICLKNNLRLPRYLIEPSNGMFISNVFVHVNEIELHLKGTLESNPSEARESAAAQMIAKLRNLY